MSKSKIAPLTGYFTVPENAQQEQEQQPPPGSEGADRNAGDEHEGEGSSKPGTPTILVTTAPPPLPSTSNPATPVLAKRLSSEDIALQQLNRSPRVSNKLPVIQFFEAVREQNLEEIRNLLLSGVNVNTKDSFMDTASHMAVNIGSLPVIEILIEFKADLNFVNANNATPFTIALLNKRDDLCRALIRGGADFIKPLKALADVLRGVKMEEIEVLTSEQYICLSHNPIATAFNLTDELYKLSLVQEGRKSQYRDCLRRCTTLAKDLLSHCKGPWEVRTVLKNNTGILEQAIKLDQKEFIAHPFTQEYLKELWLAEHNSDDNYQWTWLLLKYFLFPFFLPYYMFTLMMSPARNLFYSDLGDYLRLAQTPFVKFSGTTVSFIFFLCLLLYVVADTSTESISRSEWALFLWVGALILGEIREGLQSPQFHYVSNAWNWLDIFLMSGLCTVIALRIGIAYFTLNNESGKLVAANDILGFMALLCGMRLLNMLQVHSMLGPLQITLARVMKDLVLFFILLIVFMLSFAAGLTKVYQSGELEPTAYDSVGTFSRVLRTLFWATVGLGDITNFSSNVPGNRYEGFTQVFGELLFGTYMILVAILLLNLLIAMINNTFQRIHDNSDVEWKFGKARLIRDFEQFPVVPPPLNLVAEPVAVVLRILHINLRVTAFTSTDPAEEKAQLGKLMITLVERYTSGQSKPEMLDNEEATATAQIRHEINELKLLLSDILSRLPPPPPPPPEGSSVRYD